MAEKTPGVRNTKLLIVALGLGFLVVVVYNVHIQKVRQAGKGQTIFLLQAKDDLEPRDEINEKNVEMVEVPAKLADSLGPVIRLESRREFDNYRDEQLTRNVEIEQYLKYEDIDWSASALPSRRLPLDMRAVTLTVDQDRSPGMARQGDRVDVVAHLFLPDVGQDWYRVFEAVRVHDVGGEAREMGAGEDARAGGKSSFSKIAIELRPDTALAWERISAERSVGKDEAVRLHVCSSAPEAAYEAEGRFAPEFERLLEQAGLVETERVGTRGP